MTPHVHVLLPVHNRCSVTLRFAACLEKQTYKNYTLILIDDGSDDGTAASVCDVIPSVHVLQGDGSLWWGGGLHKGYEYLASLPVPDDDVILIANDDIEFDEDVLEKTARYLQGNAGCMASAKCYSKQTGLLLDEGVVVDWRSFTFTRVSAEETINCLATRYLFMEAGTFKRSGGFHPKLLPHYLSDYEFTIRAHRRGVKLSVADVAVYLDEKTTGMYYFEGRTWKECLTWSFSVRNPENPVYFTSFLFLTCPWRWLLLNLTRVWGVFLKRCFRTLFSQEYVHRD
jgi:GT2 family glycosyltransferase